MNDTRHAGDAGDWLRLDRQICFPLYAATNLMQRLYRPLLTPLGLTYSQYLVLLVLWERESATVGELRDCLHLDAGTITPLLKRMERGGLVTRSRDRQDERRVIIALTPHAS
ncbi:MarR family winged helix-turn-helix transcriptional regulator [Chromohalobacter israelensis]|mgnify:FL=1|uniref:MarR family winged helix-turn-helix transcriptional regulator n=1 Tax=Chromohalobacter israelensis TaxID=141390 RepID=UPI000D894E74|nr:MarR family transcriptional regulator [Chromohalobacter salexigens]PWW31736.1 MarR family protein [Chromohalobacter salexigens]